MVLTTWVLTFRGLKRTTQSNFDDVERTMYWRKLISR